MKNLIKNHKTDMLMGAAIAVIVAQNVMPHISTPSVSAQDTMKTVTCYAGWNYTGEDSCTIPESTQLDAGTCHIAAYSYDGIFEGIIQTHCEDENFPKQCFTNDPYVIKAVWPTPPTPPIPDLMPPLIPDPVPPVMPDPIVEQLE